MRKYLIQYFLYLYCDLQLQLLTVCWHLESDEHTSVCIVLLGFCHRSPLLPQVRTSRCDISQRLQVYTTCTSCAAVATGSCRPGLSSAGTTNCRYNSYSNYFYCLSRSAILQVSVAQNIVFLNLHFKHHKMYLNMTHSTFQSFLICVFDSSAPVERNVGCFSFLSLLLIKSSLFILWLLGFWGFEPQAYLKGL